MSIDHASYCVPTMIQNLTAYKPETVMSLLKAKKREVTGRSSRVRKGWPPLIYIPLLNELKDKVELGPLVTLKRVASVYKHKEQNTGLTRGTWIARAEGHVFLIRNGEVIDNHTEENRKKRIAMGELHWHVTHAWPVKKSQLDLKK